MGNWLIRNNFLGKKIEAEKRGGGIESKVIEEYTPLQTLICQRCYLGTYTRIVNSGKRM